MKAYETKLAVINSPGVVADSEDKMIATMKHFLSLSPSPVKNSVKNLKVSFDETVKTDEIPGDTTNPDEMLMAKYDKSFEKAVDWTATAVKKISFNSAAAGADIVLFFTDFEEVMATRAPYTMYE